MKKSIFGFPFVAMGLLALTCMPSPSQAAEFPVPSQWSGHFVGQVHQARFKLPVTLELGRPFPGESNPVHVFFAVGQESQVGQALLSSAQQFRTPYTGRTTTLQYLTISVRGSQLLAQLTDDHSAEAAVLNGFTAGNISAETAPPGMHDVYRSLGATEMFAFRRGAKLVMQIRGNEISGTLQGVGHSYTGIFPLPDIGYKGHFEVVRVR
jgi:hypothetical protein